MKTLNIIFALIFGALSLSAQDVYVTVYNNNLGVIKETRKVTLNKGLTRFYIADVPTQIDPTSVHLKFDGQILEQNYKYDLADKFSILRKYIDKEIELTDEKGNVTKGKLISVGGDDLVLSKSEGGLLMISGLKKYRISVNRLPEGFVTKPTLEYLAKSESEGEKKIELSYFTGGMNWQAEYVAVLNETDDELKLNSWVSITNNSGATFKNAKVKLVAGEINRAYTEEPQPVFAMEKRMNADEASFEGRDFFEYHIYELNRPTTLANREQKQIAFFNSDKIAAKKKLSLRFYAYENGKKKNAKITVEFVNDKANNLGTPLPAGKIRIFKKDKESLEFIGEDAIGHTAKNEKVILTIGKAFDVYGKCVETKKEKIAKNVYEITNRITVSNAKNEDADVEVFKSFSGDWKILNSDMKYSKVNSRTAKFIIKVPAESKRTITFTVRITR
jgi:hypothetical protein